MIFCLILQLFSSVLRMFFLLVLDLYIRHKRESEFSVIKRFYEGAHFVFMDPFQVLKLSYKHD